jgi:propanol-preferring alcohol dehydrogenase
LTRLTSKRKWHALRNSRCQNARLNTCPKAIDSVIANPCCFFYGGGWLRGIETTIPTSNRYPRLTLTEVNARTSRVPSLTPSTMEFEKMVQMMKAAVVNEFGKPLVIEDVPVPTPGAGEILVKVMACGVCHTDLHAAEGDWPVKPSLPFIPGHEVASVVAALGPGVTDFKLGDPVGVAWLHDACMRCEYCETGWETVCERQHNTGYSCDGGFAEYVVAAAPFAARLPVGVDFAQIAPILCAGVTTYKGLKETEARPGEWVAIFGIGGLGHVAIQYAKAMGLHVAALDIAPGKVALARTAGADIAVDGRSPDAVADILKATGGGAHHRRPIA